MNQLTDSEKLRLERYLGRCEKFLIHLNTLERSQMIQVTRDYLLAQVSESRRLDRVLLSYRDCTALLNQLLISQNLPLVKKKSRGVWRWIFLTLLLIILFVGYGIYWGIHRAIDWVDSNVDFDVKTESITIDKGNLRFPPMDTYPGFDRTKLQNSQNGELDSSELSSITLSASAGVFVLTGGKNFSYQCKTDQENYNPITLTKNKVLLSLRGLSRCQITIPPTIPLNVRLKQGVLQVKGLEQDLNFEVESGTVFWDSGDSQLFELETKVEGLSINTGSFAPKGTGKYQARFVVKSGVLKIK